MSTRMRASLSLLMTAGRRYQHSDRSVGELRGHGDGVDHGAVAEHRDLQACVDRLLEQQPLERLGVSQWYPTDREDEVSGPQSAEGGRAPGDDLHHPQGGALADPS